MSWSWMCSVLARPSQHVPFPRNIKPRSLVVPWVHNGPGLHAHALTANPVTNGPACSAALIFLWQGRRPIMELGRVLSGLCSILVCQSVIVLSISPSAFPIGLTNKTKIDLCHSCAIQLRLVPPPSLPSPFNMKSFQLN